MDLAEGSGCDGFLIELGKDGGGFPSQLLNNPFSDRLEMLGRNLILEQRKLIGIFGREQVDSGAHELTDLDQDPSELKGGFTKLTGFEPVEATSAISDFFQTAERGKQDVDLIAEQYTQGKVEDLYDSSLEGEVALQHRSLSKILS